MIHRIPVLKYDKLCAGVIDCHTYGVIKFRHQLALLKEKGYSSITTRQLGEHLSNGVGLPEKPVIITFDIGYAINFHFAREILHEFGFTATFFILVEWAVRSSCKEPVYAKEFMDIEQLRQLEKEGFELAIQAYEPADLNATALPDMQSSVAKSIDFFKTVGIPFSKTMAFTHDFNLSSAKRRKDIKAILQNQKIVLAFQNNNKINTTGSVRAYEIGRVAVSTNDTEKEFLRKLSLGERFWHWF